MICLFLGFNYWTTYFLETFLFSCNALFFHEASNAFLTSKM